MQQRREALLTLGSSFTGSAYCMRLGGRLDWESIDSFEAEVSRMEDSGAVEMAVDLSRLEFIDTAGMAALAAAGRRFRAGGRLLSLLGEPRRFAAARPRRIAAAGSTRRRRSASA